MEELGARVREGLVVGEEDVHADMLPLVRKLIFLDSRGGVEFAVDRSRLSLSEQLTLIFGGHWFAHQAGLVKSPAMSLDELETLVDASRKTLRARIAELANSGAIMRVGPGSYQIKYALIPRIIRDLVSRFP